MRSINARYQHFREKLPEQYPSYICFARAIKYQKYKYKMVSKWFDILVDKDEYYRKDRKQIVNSLYKLSGMAEEGEF